MQYAVLGSIQFDLITYFNGLDGKWTADFAEHARVQGKPRLQWIGDGADQWSLKLKFHRKFCTPETELAKLRKALSAHEAMAFVLANGDYKGMFVITEIASQTGHTDSKGALIDADVTLTLREDPDAQRPKPPKPAVKKAGAAAPAQAVKDPSVTVADSTIGAVGTAATGAFRVANAAVSAWQYGNISDAVGSLAIGADQALGKFCGTGGLLGRNGIPSAAEAAIHAQTARLLLVGLTSGNISARRAGVGIAMTAVSGYMSPVAREGARLAVAVATRRR
jgi:phage protein U